MPSRPGPSFVPPMDAPPLVKSDWIAAEYGQRFAAMLDAVATLADEISPGEPVDPVGQALVDVAREMARKIAPVTPCKSGCAHCCYQSVTITTWEAERIVKFTGRKRANPAGIDPHDGAPDSGELDALRTRYTGVVCPMLRHGQCTVYAVRPLACINHHSLEADAKACDIINNAGAEVPSFNDQEWTLIQAAAMWNAGQKFADIREFFPS